MFRVADIRHRSVIGPQVYATMYTWGQGRRTMEGEHIPVRLEVSRRLRRLHSCTAAGLLLALPC
jgi:hypothetical protein